MNLTRDILDQQVVDRTGQRLGKVDGVILELRDKLGTPGSPSWRHARPPRRKL